MVTDEKPRVRVASYLSPPDLHRLDWACSPIRRAFGSPPYLVGSALTRPDFRDIDLRLILDDEVMAHMFDHIEGDELPHLVPLAQPVRLLLNIALSDMIARAAGLPWPIDFQIQAMSEANVPENDSVRNPMGLRW